jgi:HipA-like C-terminal domain
MQLKFSAVMEITGGLTIPAGGMGGAWIVKLPYARFAAVPENEFAMLKLARRVGMAVPENRLVDIAHIKGLPEEARAPGGKALAVRRFDRLPDGVAVHMEDFAQVFGQYPQSQIQVPQLCQHRRRPVGRGRRGGPHRVHPPPRIHRGHRQRRHAPEETGRSSIRTRAGPCSRRHTISSRPSPTFPATSSL